MHNLGLCYLLGEGVAKNHTAAALWMRKAAEWGRSEWVEIEEGVAKLKAKKNRKVLFMVIVHSN
jgi:TPR repeat protein